MKRKIFLIIGFLCLLPSQNVWSQVFRTQTLSDNVQTLQVHVSGNWERSPIIELNSNDQIDISFDVLDVSRSYYTYTLIHCNADWTPSQLVMSEYLNGLQHNYIEDYAHSFNTTIDYVNYQFSLPNTQVQLKISGNYVVQVWDESNQPLLNACFSVVDSQTGIQMQVSSVTDKGINTHYQAVSFEINYGDEIRIPLQDLKVYVQQNRRFDNEATLIKPLNVQNRKVVYNHNPALIFAGGNEYRAFEMTTTKYNGLNIASVEYHAPYYHTFLKPDHRRGKYYSYYEDLNGRIYIRNQDVEDSNIEADYEWVHFYIPCDQPHTENIYILSDAFHNQLDIRSQMEYNLDEKGYVKTVLLKEGYYNYLYVTGKDNISPASTDFWEGNHYETENEYRVMVYFRPLGGRYDQLIGVQTIQYK